MRQQKLKLTSCLPLNQLTSRHALLAQGFSSHTLDNYLKSGVLEKVVKGVYMRQESRLNWQSVVASLPNLVDEPVAVGGLTALELQGFAQYLPLNTQQKVHLYSPGYCPVRLKVIFKQLGVGLQWHKTARLWKKGWPEDIKLNEHKWHEDSASMQVSTPEQAILEVLMSLPGEISFEHAEQLMQGLTQLSPRKLESLLQSCKSVKVKRLFFWFTDRFTYPWCNALRLVVRKGDVRIKIELSPVLRGTVFDPEICEVAEHVEDQFGYVSVPLVSLADLYGGKICAALDRQHPRDLFDVKLLMENEGITEDIRKAMLVYMMSHPRPISELIAPHFQNIRNIYEHEFIGMSRATVSLVELESTRKALVDQIGRDLTTDEKAFLILFKMGKPDWSLLGLPDVEHLPAVRWKLLNLNKMNPGKRNSAVEKLKQALKMGDEAIG